MDVLPSPSSAAGLLGCSSSHAFVYLAQILQETCIKMEECTDGDVQLSVTLCRSDGRNGVLLFASGYLDGGPPVDISEQIENQIASGVDSMVSALQELAVEGRARRRIQPMNDMQLTPSVFDQRRSAVSDDGGEVATNDGGNDVEDYHVGDGGSNGEAWAYAARGSAPSSPHVSTTLEDGIAVGAGLCGRFGASTSGCDSRSSTALGARSTPRGSPPPQSPVIGYIMDKKFRVPGLTVPPARIIRATGHGTSRRDPPPVSKEPVRVPVSIVLETIAELSAVDRHDSLRRRLVRFSALYKFVIDTLVDRGNAGKEGFEKADHRYPQLTPEALRGLLVTLEWEGQDYTIQTPMIQNSHDMKVPDTLAVIGVMKMQKDPFFLWLLGHFSRGALAQPENKSAAGASGRGKGRKRARAASLPPMPPGHRPGVSAGGAGGSIGGAAAAAASGEATVVGVSGIGGGSSGRGSVDAAMEHVRARLLMSDGRVVATAELHPEWSTMHHNPMPLSVVPCFLRGVSDGCGGVTYPFGQDPALCLEKGYPAAEPVSLSTIDPSYKIAWPIEHVGYVRCSSRSAPTMLLFSLILWPVRGLHLTFFSVQAAVPFVRSTADRDRGGFLGYRVCVARRRADGLTIVLGGAVCTGPEGGDSDKHAGRRGVCGDLRGRPSRERLPLYVSFLRERAVQQVHEAALCRSHTAKNNGGCCGRRWGTSTLGIAVGCAVHVVLMDSVRLGAST